MTQNRWKLRKPSRLGAVCRCLLLAIWLSVVGQGAFAESIELVGVVDTPGYARDVVVSGSLAFVADGYHSGLQIVDASIPTSPVIVGSCVVGESANSVAVAGSLAFVADNTSGLLIVDVSDPAAPVLRGSYIIPAQSFAYHVAAAGSLAYMDCWGGMMIIDFSDLDETFVRATCSVFPRAVGIVPSGSLVYTGGFYDFHIFDVSDPDAPVLRSRTENVGGHLAVSGPLACLADYMSYSLVTVDVREPRVPFFQGMYREFPTNEHLNGIGLSGTLAYISSAGTLKAIDITNPAEPRLAGAYTPWDAKGLAVSDSLIYLAVGRQGLLILRQIEPHELDHWGFAAPGAPMTMPSAEVVSNSLRLETTSNSANFGFWGSQPDTAPIAPDAFYRTAWTVSTDITSRSLVPSMRLRVNASNGQQANYLSVDSTDDGRFSPDLDGETYELCFESPASVSLGDLYSKSAVHWQFAFDLANFDPGDASSGWLALDSFAYERLPRPTTGTVVRHHDFEASDEGWGFMPPIDGFNPPAPFVTTGALGMTATTNALLFGCWTSPASDALLSGAEPLTRVVFRARTDKANKAVLPTLRLRLNLSIGHEASVLQVDSTGDCANGPGTNGRDYSLYFVAPPGAFGEGVTLAFDMLNFNAYDSRNAALFLDDVRVETMAKP